MNPEDMLTLSDRKLDIATQYKEAQINYSKNKTIYQRLLGKQIMKNEKMGIEKLISLSMADKEFDTAYKGYQYYKAYSKGLEAEIDAIGTKIISIQSFLKYCGNNDGGH